MGYSSDGSEFGKEVPDSLRHTFIVRISDDLIPVATRFIKVQCDAISRSVRNSFLLTCNGNPDTPVDATGESPKDAGVNGKLWVLRLDQFLSPIGVGGVVNEMDPIKKYAAAGTPDGGIVVAFGQSGTTRIVTRPDVTSSVADIYVVKLNSSLEYVTHAVSTGGADKQVGAVTGDGLGGAWVAGFVKAGSGASTLKFTVGRFNKTTLHAGEGQSFEWHLNGSLYSDHVGVFTIAKNVTVDKTHSRRRVDAVFDIISLMSGDMIGITTEIRKDGSLLSTTGASLQKVSGVAPSYTSVAPVPLDIWDAVQPVVPVLEPPPPPDGANPTIVTFSEGLFIFVLTACVVIGAVAFWFIDHRPEPRRHHGGGGGGEFDRSGMKAFS